MFDKISAFIDQLVIFITNFANNLRKFIAGFQTDVDFIIPGTDAE